MNFLYCGQEKTCTYMAYPYRKNLYQQIQPHPLCIFLTLYDCTTWKQLPLVSRNVRAPRKMTNGSVDLNCFIYHSVHCLQCRFVSSSKVQYKMVRKSFFPRPFVGRTCQTSHKLYLLRRNAASATFTIMCTDIYTCNYNFYILKGNICVSISKSIENKVGTNSIFIFEILIVRAPVWTVACWKNSPTSTYRMCRFQRNRIYVASVSAAIMSQVAVPRVFLYLLAAFLATFTSKCYFL